MKRFTQIIFISCLAYDVLPSIRPKAEWNVRGDTYAGIEWLDKTQVKPTQKEVDQAISDCQAQEVAQKTQKQQAIIDAKDTNKDAQTRLDALIKAIDLK